MQVIHREEDKVKDFQHQGEKESPKKDPLIKIKGAGAEKLKLGKFLKGKSGEKKEKKIDFEKDKDRLVKPEDKEEKEKKKKEKIKARRKLQKERKREKKKQQIPVSAEKKVQNKEEATDPSFTIESKGTEDQGESGKEHVQFDQFQKQGNGDKEIKADEIPLKFTDGTELKVPDHKALEITGVNTEEAGKVDTY